MPSVADVNSKENQDIADIQSVGLYNKLILLLIKAYIIPLENSKNSLTTISGFLRPTEVDFNSYLSKLVPLKYSEHKEVELETPESANEKQLKLTLGNIKDGLILANILVDLHKDNFDADEFLNNSCESDNSGEDIKEDEKKVEIIEESKETTQKYVNPKIDGYSQDELEDCIESDSEFNPSAGEENKSKLNTIEVLRSREDIINHVPQRASFRDSEKRAKLKEKFISNITNKDWNNFKAWYDNQCKIIK